MKPPERLELEQAPGVNCPVCGARNDPGRVFCHACGERLVPLPAAAPTAQARTSRPWLIIAAVVILIVAGLAAGVGLGRVYVGNSATPAPSAPAGSGSGGQPTPGASGVVPAAFVCTAVSGQGSATAPAVLSGVTLGKHDTYDTAVFAFGGGIPGYQIAPVSPPFQLQSGKAVAVQGSSYLRLTFSPGSAVGPDGKPVYTGASDLKAKMPALRELVKVNDAGGSLEWIAGLNGPGCFRARVGTSGIVIDFQH